MNRYLGTAICHILRGHKFRRLHKPERDARLRAYAATPVTGMAEGIDRLRVCDRCLTTKTVKARKK